MKILGAMDMMKIIEEANKFTEEHSGRQKRQLAALLGSIPLFLVKTIGPLFSNLLSAGAPHVDAKFAQNLIPHTELAHTDTHDSICSYIENGNGHDIMNVIEDHSKDWNVEEAFPEGGLPSKVHCRANIQSIDKNLKQRLGSSTLASNTFIQTLLSHMSKTIQERIHLAAINLTT